MFDLFRRRDRAVRILLGAILLMVAASMLLYLVPNYDTGNTSSPDQVVAQVGKETITVNDIQKLIQSNLRNQRLPAEIIPNYIPQMVQDMVTERALAYEAERLGFQVTDQDVRDMVKQMVPTLFPDGNFVGKEAYAAMLAQQNITIPEFEDSLRRQVLIDHLRRVATENVVVSPAEIEQEFQNKNEKLKVQWVLLKSDMYAKESEPTEQDLKAYYDANKSAFQTPEKKNLAVLIGDQAKLQAAIQFSDAELQSVYNQMKDQFRVMERVKARHILLMTQGKPPSEDAQIKAKAEDLLKQIKNGADFAGLAKKNSDDKGSAVKGGDLDWITRGQLGPELEQVAFSLKPGQTSDVVKTPIGYDIIQVLQHENGGLQPFEQVKGQIESQMRTQKAAIQMQQIADKAETALKNDPAHPEKVAADLGMQLVRADGVEAGKPVPEVGASQDFEQAIAPLKKGEVSPAVALPMNRVALAIVTDVQPPRPSTFDEVKGQIRTALLASRTSQAVRKHAQELYEKAKADGNDLEKAAKSMGLTAKTADDVTTTGSVEGLGSATSLAEGFRRPDGSLIQPVGTPDGTLVYKVLAHLPPDPVQFAAQRNSIRDQIKSERARDRETLFEAGLRDALTKQGKIKIRQQAIQNLVAQYRTS